VKTLAILLVLAFAPASADPCKPAGAVQFQIEHGPISPQLKAAGFTLKLYDNGAWTRDETTTGGKPGPSTAGCLDKDALAKVQDALKAATWKITTAKIRCMAKSVDHTVYSVKGTAVFTQELCSGKSLDDASAKSLADIQAILDKSAAAKP
jgi:hypothetical protein